VFVSCSNSSRSISLQIGGMLAADETPESPSFFWSGLLRTQ
jgi:hypothetical protein